MESIKDSISNICSNINVIGWELDGAGAVELKSSLEVLATSLESSYGFAKETNILMGTTLMERFKIKFAETNPEFHASILSSPSGLIQFEKDCRTVCGLGE